MAKDRPAFERDVSNLKNLFGDFDAMIQGNTEAIEGIASITLDFFRKADLLYIEMAKHGMDTFRERTSLIIFLCQASIQASARMRALGQRPLGGRAAPQIGAPTAPKREEIEPDYHAVSTEELDRMVGGGNEPV